MERFFYIDAMRFCAIFFVTGFHVSRFIGFDNMHSFGKIFKNLFITGGWLGCCLFFLISGYCLCIKYDENSNYFEFIKNRLLKILPTYYIAMLIWYFLIKMGVAPKPIGLSAILSHIFLVHTFDNANFYSMSGVFWFLGVLFNFYLIFPFLYKLQHKMKYGLEILTIFVFAISVFLSWHFHIQGSVFNRSILIHLPCFTFGMMLYNKQNTIIFRNKVLKFLLLVVSIALLLFTKMKDFMGTPINILAIFDCLLLGTLFISFKNELEKFPLLLKDLISQVAVASYSIYLYNYIFCTTIPLYKNSTFIFIYMLFVFGFGICMYRLIEKPVNKFIKKNIEWSKCKRDNLFK